MRKGVNKQEDDDEKEDKETTEDKEKEKETTEDKEIDKKINEDELNIRRYAMFEKWNKLIDEYGIKYKTK